MTDLQVTYKDPKSLRTAERNARTHSAKQIRQIGRSIEEFGFNNPVLIDDDDRIIAGHGRVEAAKLLKMKTVPTLSLRHLTPAKKKAYILTDNRLAELSGWDEELLALELQGLLDADLDFDIDVTGFEMGDIDRLLGEDLGDPPKNDAADDFASAISGPPIAKSGDLWQLGPHWLLCGDALVQESYQMLLGDERAQMIFTDHPYNVKIAGNVSGSGRHQEFAMASGEMSEGQFRDFLCTSMAHMEAASVDGALHYLCMDWRSIDVLIASAKAEGAEIKNLCVWTKSNGGMGSLYRSQHELILVFKTGTAPHVNNVELGKFGRNRTNIWSYPGMSSMRKGSDKVLLALHPTVKPVALVADVMLDSSTRGGVVLDPFAGSGTVFIAAERTKRRAFGIEISPAYVDVILRRYRSFSKAEPVHTSLGMSLADMESQCELT